MKTVGKEVCKNVWQLLWCGSEQES